MRRRVVPVKVEEQDVEPKIKKIEDDVIDFPKSSHTIGQARRVRFGVLISKVDFLLLLFIVSVFLFGELVVFLFQVCYEYSLWHRDDYKDIHYKDRKHGGSRETSDCEKPGARNKDRNYSRIPIADNVAANCSPAVGLTLDSIASAFSLYGTVKGVYPADESGCRVIVSYDDETSAQTALNAFMF
ncbi:hypothetical protein Tco_0561773 [Tanacetum coccineum]